MAEEIGLSLIEQYTARCSCGFESVEPHKYLVLKTFLDHLRQEHPKFYFSLELEGRKLARQECNGCGYFDSDYVDGWSKAQPGFRTAWVTHALEDAFKGR